MEAARHSDSIGHWLTWQRPGQDERELGRSMAIALARSGLCVMMQDEQGRYLFIINLCDLWRVDGDPNDLTLFGEKIANQLADLKQRVTETQKADQLEVVVGLDRAFEFSVEPITTSSGKMHMLTRVVDLSDKRNAERVTENLMREVSHRSKNLLAIVQSIAVQTARQTHSVEKFIEDFRGRLMAISRAQDLVTESSWRGAWLHDLIELQADGYVPEGNGAINFKGLNIRLEPSAALHVGLAFHELITNAVANRSFKGNGTKSVTVDKPRRRGCHPDTLVGATS